MLSTNLIPKVDEAVGFSVENKSIISFNVNEDGIYFLEYLTPVYH